ncbi:hypothetical protein PVAND_000719 [Polypedilum vanderplanki]|uniref:Aminotransferase class V domain-containing protein n=1 Tax=Polypedilum vanderplanki TaxID=319348 RepID=A0A9J6BL69_POLVA|nr:hypothetical protein PVAND_000719 [Polypedilum vanderplanki]
MSATRKQRPVKTISICQDFVFPKSVTRERRPQKTEDTQKLLKYIDDAVIGKGSLFFGPFGRRKVVYANYSTSGRSLQFLEDYILKEVLPAYGDLNCTSSVTGLQSNLYDTESRDLIKHAVNATDDDEIIFCNNPSNRLAQLFGIGNSYENNEKYNRVILFVSYLEPYANIKPWIDLNVQVEKIKKNIDGFLDLVDLERKLCLYKESGCKLVGLFSTVSRLTGILADDVATTILLHQYGAISVWDYTDSCSSAQINVNPDLPLATKDAIFFSCCNMIGGVQAGGILIVKKSIMQNLPSIRMEMINSINIVRCGLVMQLKETLGTHIMTRNEKICKQVLSHIRTIPEIILIGPSSTVARRIPTISFLIKHPRGTFLHHRFVVAVLNDVFGIQSTANNLINQALGISDNLKVEYEKCIKNQCNESISPGYTCLTFPFFMTDAEINFILESLKMVAQEGWKLLIQYEMNTKNGEWRHHTNALAKERKWLHSIRYNDGRMLFNDRRISAPDRLPQNYGDCLQTARNIFSRARKTAQRSNSNDSFFATSNDEETEKLRWFILPREAHELLLGPSQNVKNLPPFDPKNLVEKPLMLDFRLLQKSRSLIDSLKPLKTSPPLENQNSSAYSSPPSPIVRFSLGGDTQCAMSNFSHPISIPNRNSCSSDTEQDISEYVRGVTKEISDEIKSEIREVISKVEDVLENSESVNDMQALCVANVNCAEDMKSESELSAAVARNTNLMRQINNMNDETKLTQNQRRSDSLPIQPVYTGAISKLKTVTHNELSSQDSGINMSFNDDERRKTRNFSDDKMIIKKECDT